MLECIEFDYNNKSLLERFYVFYQDFLLRDYDFDAINSYQNFIEKLIINDNCNAFIITDRKQIIGGFVFDYIKEENTAIVKYATSKNLDEMNDEVLVDLSYSALNDIAKENGFEKIGTILETPKKKHSKIILDKSDFLLSKVLCLSKK